MTGATGPLHPIEKAILSTLFALGDKSVSLEELSGKSSLTLDQIRRGVEWLKAKKFVEAKEIQTIKFTLGPEGKNAVAHGLPERRLVNVIRNSGGTLEISKAARELGMEFAPAFGRSKRNGWVRVEANKILLAESVDSKEDEEMVLEKLAHSERIAGENLSSSELKSIEELIKWHNGYVLREETKTITLRLTPQGIILARAPRIEEVDEITPQLLQSGTWKNKPLRALDVTSPSPRIFAGKKHPMRIFMDEVRETFVSLGFEEIFGPIIQSALWNFDALFIPQEHSAREMQDTFYISGLRAKLDDFKEQMKEIRSVHETGGHTGSTGWQYKWKEEAAAKVVLRTHTTAVTISYLARNKPEEARVFSVGRVFRNEKTNYKHNPEFYQIEGVMVGEKLNLRNLIYILSKFYSKLGFDEIKFWPTYFPYTEPSLQTMAFVKETQRWMELGGLGIFRPEVTLPLGVKNTVLAWGLSLDRLVMLRYGVKDIRQLFGANLDWLRSVPLRV